jgi:peptide/nickel transport system substrate-binding protein
MNGLKNTKSYTPFLHLLALVCLSLVGLSSMATAATLKETPSLKAAVEAKKLPPIDMRLPQVPRVIDLKLSNRSPGKHGGSLKMLMGKQKDIRMMTVYGYARLVVYDENLNLVPDILESFEVEDNRIFTLRLRPGHKWSDGQPFTSEDFRYFWEDVATNKALSRGTMNKNLLANNRPPRFEVLDEVTVRYTWDAPNPEFLPALAGSRPLYIYRPAHYLKRFHAKYNDVKKLNAEAKAKGSRDWAAYHRRISRQYRPENPDLPSLQPWVNSTRPPANRFTFVRNPFYHRIDTIGQQLPYIDKVLIDLGSAKIIPTKTGSGESDLQGRYLRFDNYTFLKQGEKRNNYKVRLWGKAIGAQIALFPNLNAKDKVWGPLLRDVRFRRALSLAIDRREINQVIYYGLANESANTMLPGFPLYKPEYQNAWTDFDIKTANRLLDEIGLTKRNENNVRLLPDGQVAQLIVETAGEDTEQTDVLELVRDSWAKIGIALFTRASQRDVFRARIQSGQTLMSVWSGIENAIANPNMSPTEFAPTSGEQLQWPLWGRYVQSGGKSGEMISDPQAQKLLDLYLSWRIATTEQQRTEIWQKMLKISAQQVYSIGIVNGTQQPVVIRNTLKNVPIKGIYTWEPGAYFGQYMMDTFWFEGALK